MVPDGKKRLWRFFLFLFLSPQGARLFFFAKNLAYVKKKLYLCTRKGQSSIIAKDQNHYLTLIKQYKIMEAITFTPAQVHVFNLVSHIKSAAALEQLREQLAAFYAQKVDEEMDQLWDSGEWNEQKLQSLRGSHFRTPYHV